MHTSRLDPVHRSVPPLDESHAAVSLPGRIPPFTSSADAGDAVPIPTLPPEVMRSPAAVALHGPMTRLPVF